MSKFFQRFIAVVLSLSLTAILVSGCAGSKSGDSTEPKTDAQTTGEASTTPKEKMKVSWAAWVLGPVDKNSYAEQELEKEFSDIDFDLLAFERATWHDQINTRVAGGDMPDIIYRDAQNFVVDYVKQGILAEVPFETARKNAPNIYKATTEYAKEVWLACYYDGKNYGLPIMQPTQMRTFTNAWRKDWLDKVGIAKIPETIDEAEAVFKKFVEEDPDGNNTKDTYGLTFRGKDVGHLLFAEIFSAFGTLPYFWINQPDGTVKFGLTTPEAKEAVALLNRWYKAGYIDPEFVTTDNAIFKQKLANGKVGYLTLGTWGRLIPGGEFYEDLKAVNPDGEYIMAPALKGPNGKYGYINGAAMSSSVCFGKQLEQNQEKLARVLQVVDKIESDKVFYGKLRYGQEGVHWQRNPENNGVLPIAPYNDSKQTGPIGNNFFVSLAATPEVQAYYARKDEPELYKYAIDGNIKDSYIPWLPLFVSPDANKIAQTTDPKAVKWIIDFITGAKPLSQFDQFVKEWEEAGGATLIEEYNKAYKTGKEQMEAIVAKIN